MVGSFYGNLRAFYYNHDIDISLNSLNKRYYYSIAIGGVLQQQTDEEIHPKDTCN
jgi:hypothetical protein